MKTYVEWRYSCTILDIGYRQVISFMARLLYPRGAIPQSRSGCCGKEENLMLLAGKETRSPCPNTSLYRLSCPDSV
jgi:hypothetical protein